MVVLVLRNYILNSAVVYIAVEEELNNAEQDGSESGGPFTLEKGTESSLRSNYEPSIQSTYMAYAMVLHPAEMGFFVNMKTQ